MFNKSITLLKITMNIMVLMIIATISMSCGKKSITQPMLLLEIGSFQELEKISEFSFAIMNDNVDDSLKFSTENAKMMNWVAERNDQFVIGLGNHLKKDLDSSFFETVKANQWWRQNFYPNIAGNENEFYGNGKDDWGAGGRMLTDFDFHQNENVEMCNNGCEYYAKIDVNGYIIHLIQLHFSDQPEDDKLAFREDSRQYLLTTLQNIEKSSKDIIIVAAHARSGHWIDDIGNRDLKLILLRKCDLVLCATNHRYGRKSFPGFEPTGAVLLNTGSLNHSSKKGYVHVSVIKEPLRMVIQYINIEDDEMSLQHDRTGILKYVGGLITTVDIQRTDSD